jgi:Domain of unknown function (DUF4349)
MIALNNSAGRLARRCRAIVIAGAIAGVAGGSMAGCSSRSNVANSTEAAADFAPEAAAAATEAAAMKGTGFSADEFSAAPPTTVVAGSVQAKAAGESAASLPDLGIAGTYAPIGSAQIKRAELTLAIPTPKFNSAVVQLTALPGSVGGFITSSNFGGGEELSEGRRAPRSGVVMMRVPSNQFDAVRKRLPSFGNTVSEQISGEEVSAQLVDLNARLTSLRLQEDSYRKLFVAAKQIQDIITVQERITEVRTQIEQIGAQRASLQDQVAMSTITVNVREKMAAKAENPKSTEANGKKSFAKRVSKGWKGGTDALVALLTAIVVVLVVLAPFLPVIVLSGVVAWWCIRRSRRRTSASPQSRNATSANLPTASDPDTAVDEREDVLV